MEHELVTGSTGDAVLHDVAPYQRLIGKLLYATTSRPDISYAVQALSQFMQSRPKKTHWEAAIRVVRYLKGTVGQGVWLHAKPTTVLVGVTQIGLLAPIQEDPSEDMWSSLVNH